MPAMIRLVLRRSDRGFTLVEMLVVIMIFGILATLALPSYNIFVAGQRIKGASFDIMVMLTLARSEAIKRNAPVTAAPTNGNWSQGWTVTAANGTILSRQNALRGVTLACMQGNPLAVAACGSLTYGNSGRITGGTQSIQINSSIATTEAAEAIYSRCIGIDLSGRPNSKKGNC